METALTARILDRIDQVAPAAWDACAGSENPFVSHAFLRALEVSHSVGRKTGWMPQHLVIESDDKTLLAAAPVYVKSHSQGEYVFDHGWANAFEQAGGRYYPKLQASVPFTPVTAPKMLTARDDLGLKQALLLAAQGYADERGISSVHATFVPQEESELAMQLGWLLRTDTQYHWHNSGFGSFDDYLETMSSRHRKVTRRERKDALEGLSVRWLTGAEITEADWDAFFEFYMDTGNRKWGRPYLNRK